MFGHSLVRNLYGLAAVAAICAAGGTIWYLKRPGDSPPPLAPLAELLSSREGELSDDQNLSLAETDRAYLWDLEHHGNVLNAHGFTRFAEAMRNADAKAMFGLLAEDFKGELLQDPKETEVRSEVLQ